MPEVTVGIPFRNETTQLSTAVASVLEQDFRDFELILVGDDPSDEALAVASGFSDSRIRVFILESSTGLGAALNHIARLAAGTYLFRMDADDAMVTGRLTAQLALIKDNPCVDVLASRAWVMDEFGFVRGRYAERDIPVSNRGFLNNGIITHPTVAAATAWHLENPYANRYKRGQDKALWISTCDVARFKKIDIPLLYYRLDSRNFAIRRMASARNDRKIVLEVGRKAVGLRLALQAYVWALFKSFVYISMDRLLTPGQLYALRVETPSASSMNDAAARVPLDLTLDIEDSATTSPDGICAVVVTYGDRASSACEALVAALRAGCTRAVVVRNGSNSSFEISALPAWAQQRVEVYSQDNVGSAGGFERGLREALKRPASGFWLLDDDNVVRIDALRRLRDGKERLRSAGYHNAVALSHRPLNRRQVTALVDGSASGVYPRAGSFLYFDLRDKVRAFQKAVTGRRFRSSPSHIVAVPYGPYGGLLLERGLVEEIGTPQTGLVLYEDDTEYTLRINSVGYNLFLVRDSVIDEPDDKWSGPSGNVRGPSRLLTATQPVRRYYSVRNRVWLDYRRSFQSSQTRFWYYINRLSYSIYLTVLARSGSCNAALSDIRGAVADGENGCWDRGPVL